MITNPFYTLCDLPWLGLSALLVVLGPWRFIWTFMRLSEKIKHFPDDEVRRVIDYSLVLSSLGLLLRDYMMFPLYIISLIHPFHWKVVVWDILLSPKSQIDYSSLQ